MALTGIERQMVESLQRAKGAGVEVIPRHHLFDFPVRVSTRRMVRAARRLSRRPLGEDAAAAADWLRVRRGVDAGGGLGVLVPAESAG